MKNYLFILGFVFSLSVFTSCSVDDVEEYETSTSRLKAPMENSANAKSVDPSSVESFDNSGNSDDPSVSPECQSSNATDPDPEPDPIDPIKPPTKP